MMSFVEIENEVLREQYLELKKASAILADRVDKYMRQECLRSELLNRNKELKSLLK